MKRFMFFLFTFMFGLVIANAEISYEPRWVNEKNSLYYIKDSFQVSDGVLLAGIDNNEKAIISKLDNTGKEVKTLSLDYEGIIFGLFESNGKYYAIGSNSANNNEIIVFEITLDLTIVRQKETNYFLSRMLGLFDVVDNKLYVASGSDGVIGVIYDEDMNSYPYMTVTLNDLEAKEGNIEDIDVDSLEKDKVNLFRFYTSDFAVYDLKSNDKVIALIGQTPGSSYVEFYDSDSEDLLEDWDNEDYINNYLIDNAPFYTNLGITDEYVVAGGAYYKNLDFFDFNGEHLESVNLYEMIFEEESDAYFEVTNIDYKNGKLNVAYYVCSDDYEDCNSGVVSYQNMYKINVNATDNGKVTIVKDSEFGDEIVTLNVSANSGYELGGIKVTDSNGNVIKVTNNTFVMPFADVTVDATFVPKNPETASGVAIFSALIVLFLSLIVGLINFRRIRELR